MGNLYLPDAITTIGDGAFQGCKHFEGNLELPNQLQTIGDYAFDSCTGLSGELIFPAGVISIGGSAFCNCLFTKASFKGNAPQISPAQDWQASFDAQKITIDYDPNMTGWTDSPAYDNDAGTWNGYKLSNWDPNWHPRFATTIKVTADNSSINDGDLVNLNIEADGLLKDTYVEFTNGQGAWPDVAYSQACTGNGIEMFGYSTQNNTYYYDRTIAVTTPVDMPAPQATLMAADPNIYERSLRVVADGISDQPVYSNSVTISLVGQGVNPMEVPLTVSSKQNLRGKEYTFSTAINTRGTNAYLVFDAPATGNWLDHEFCRNQFKLKTSDWQQDPNTGMYVLRKTLPINSCGNLANGYLRYVKLVVCSASGDNYETPSASFAVKPNANVAAVTGVTHTVHDNGITFQVTILLNPGVPLGVLNPSENPRTLTIQGLAEFYQDSAIINE